VQEISQQAFGGKFGGSSNRDSTFVVAVLTPLRGKCDKFRPLACKLEAGSQGIGLVASEGAGS
jgi:hypothetical protein